MHILFPLYVSLDDWLTSCNNDINAPVDNRNFISIFIGPKLLMGSLTCYFGVFSIYIAKASLNYLLIWGDVSLTPL